MFSICFWFCSHHFTGIFPSCSSKQGSSCQTVVFFLLVTDIHGAVYKCHSLPHLLYFIWYYDHLFFLLLLFIFLNQFFYSWHNWFDVLQFASYLSVTKWQKLNIIFYFKRFYQSNLYFIWLHFMVEYFNHHMQCPFRKVSTLWEFLKTGDHFEGFCMMFSFIWKF